MSVIEENEISIDDNNNDETDDGKITKTKPKKPRTEAQMNAFKEVMKKRAENIEIKKHEKLIKASEILVNNSKKEVKTKEFIKQVKPPVYETSSSEEEIIIVKAKPKKKKKKTIIIEDSSSNSSGDDSDGGRGKYKKPQQVSIQREIPKPVFNSNDYFL